MFFFALFIFVIPISMLAASPSNKQRKRRRQAWHAKHFHTKKKDGKWAGRKARPTKDQGQFDAPLKQPRRVICIADKLKVIAFYQKMKAEKNKKKQTILAKCKAKGGTGQLKDRSDSDASLGSVSKNANLEVLCREKFPDIVGNALVCKWIVTAAREGWTKLPKQVARRVSTTPNEWRQKFGLSSRGRKHGGHVPHVLQVELDRLISEMTSGMSDICERKEIVTAEDVVSGFVCSQLCMWLSLLELFH